MLFRSELFYDIFFSILFSKLIIFLSKYFSITSFFQFLILFLISWFGWFNGANYVEKHGHDDLRTRVFTLLQMFFCGGMVIFSNDAFGSNYIGFALSYGLLLLVQAYLFFVVAIKENKKIFSIVKSILLFVPALGYFISVAFSSKVRIYFLIVFLTLDCLSPIILLIIGKIMHKKNLCDTVVVTRSLVSRFSRFSMIVLANSVGAIINGGIEQGHISGQIFVYFIIGFIIIISVWWSYFDHMREFLPKNSYKVKNLWLAIHVLMMYSIAIISSAFGYVMHNISNNITYHDITMHVYIPLAAYYLTLFLLMFVMDYNSDKHKMKVIQGSIFITMFLLGIFCFIDITNIFTTILLVVIMLVPLVVSAYMDITDNKCSI